MPLQQYHLELSLHAQRDLKKLPVAIQHDIVFNHLPKIEQDPYATTIPLAGALKGERSYHFGRKPEYRIICYIEADSIIVTLIGSRENIYQRAKRRKKFFG